MKTTRETTSLLVLRTIFLEGPLSRKSIGEVTGLDISTVSRTVDRLIRDAMVQEIGTESSDRGPKPILLGLVSDAQLFAGIDISSTKVTSIVSGIDRKVFARDEQIVSHQDTTEDVISKIRTGLRNCFDSLSPQLKGRIQSISVGTAGPVDFAEGLILNPPNLKQLSNYPIGQILSNIDNLPIHVDERSNMATLTEMTLGYGSKYRNFIYVNVGYGLGSGIVVNGSLYHGARGMAGELGHVTINIDGPVCSCGSRGCLELYFSGMAFEGSMQKLPGGRGSVEKKRKESQGNELKKVDEYLGTSGLQPNINSATRKIVEDAVPYFAVGLRNTINQFDPQAVFISETTFGLSEFICDLLGHISETDSSFKGLGGVNFLPSTFGFESPLIGPPLLGILKYLKSSAVATTGMTISRTGSQKGHSHES